MSDVDGSFVTEIDGVEYYTEGMKHSGSSFSANIAYISFSRKYDQITDTGAWTVGASTKNPVVNVDKTRNVRLGGQYGVLDVGVVRYADGTTGVYNVPVKQWKHIRTTNPIESVFATIRNRTRKTKGCTSRKTALASVFTLMVSDKKKWRKISGPNRLPEVIQRDEFKDGIKHVQIAA